MENYNQTKTLLIDMTGAIFNKRNDFFHQQNYFNKPHWKNLNYTKHHLFVLTILTEKLKQFLNSSLNADFLKVYNQSESDNILLINNEKLLSLINKNISIQDETNNESIKFLSATLAGRQKRNNFDNTIIQLIKNYTSVIQENYLKINFTKTKRNSLNQNRKSEILEHNNKNTIQRNKMKNNLLNLCTGNSCENSINSHISFCENILKLNRSIDNVAIKSICKQLAIEQSDEKIINVTSNSDKSDSNNSSKSEKFINKNVKRSVNRDSKQSLNETQPRTEYYTKSDQRPIVSFGEFFNLFDFIASTMLNDAKRPKNASDNSSFPIKFDFIVLDFHTILLNRSIETIEWRPYLILQQNQINQRLFTTHHVGGTSTIDYADWMLNQTNIWWTCGIRCWSITTLAMIIFIVSIVASVIIGIWAR